MFVFVPAGNQSAVDLLNRMVRAGHHDVSVDGDRVVMSPFEHDGNFWVWADSMQRHFECELVEII